MWKYDALALALQASVAQLQMHAEYAIMRPQSPLACYTPPPSQHVPQNLPDLHSESVEKSQSHLPHTPLLARFRPAVGNPVYNAGNGIITNAPWEALHWLVPHQ